MHWEMKHRNCLVLLDYWRALRGRGSVPDQNDIRPQALKAILPHVFILDNSDRAGPVFRLAGTAVCEQFGFELRGAPFLSYWEAQCQPLVASMLRNARNALEPVCLYSIATHAGGGWGEFETALAPLAHDGKAGVRFIGVMQPVAHVPRLRYGGIVSQRLVVSEVACVPPKPDVIESRAVPQPPSSIRLAFLRLSTLLAADRSRA